MRRINEASERGQKTLKKKAVLNDLWILVLDIIAVNLSYYLALLIRFFVNGEFRPTVKYYLTDFAHFAPFYTIIAIAIFFLFKLYGGMWMYAGLNDMNRIIVGSLTASVIHVVGTLIFIRRMPITYYVIGAVLQLVFLIIIRFSYRVLLVEKKKLKREEFIPAMVVGSGELGRKVIRHLEENTPYRASVIIGEGSGRTMDGIPVVGMEELEKVKDKVKAIFIADKELKDTDREKLKATGVDISDFTGALTNMTGAVPVTGLMESIVSPVTVVIDGKENTYKNGSEALANLHTKYLVTGIKGDKLKIELKPDDGMAYLRQHKEETGEELSFF